LNTLFLKKKAFRGSHPIQVWECFFAMMINLITGQYYSSFGQVNDSSNRTALELKGTRNLRSNYYYSETLKYIDLMLKISGYDNVDFLKEYDTKVR
jgi:hypothetical protein